ncbi:hypothetical protein D5039_09440 [Verminephrobacter aporrectodeae subsp. tuberculatae]|uniref:CobQ/CobB/MinD/ParA nucleotide binding domain-containing protein n=2 Tax=Verminephrobacter TaxID=364316 RepID=A0ABT3KSR1_9BURK|nr:hypothetical protein [Verminephrobacter aporrectodeae subsp. tuberculatae]
MCAQGHCQASHAKRVLSWRQGTFAKTFLRVEECLSKYGSPCGQRDRGTRALVRRLGRGPALRSTGPVREHQDFATVCSGPWRPSADAQLLGGIGMSSMAGLLDWKSVEDALVEVLEQNPQSDRLRALLAGEALILVRNWYGQLVLLLPCHRDELERSPCGPLIDALKEKAGPLALSPWTLCRDELFDAESYWADPSLLQLFGVELLLLERQDKERDWLTPTDSKTNTAHAAKRCVFFSVKGGVGRSAALIWLAIACAQRGRRVLVVDGDFESPGLSSSLLPRGDGQPAYGVIDWLTAQALGADPEALERMALEHTVESSPLNARLALPGEILVAPAYGNHTQAYVAKLARIYRQSPDGKAYARRINDFLLATEKQHRIDVTLFDCRAGIDDTAAVAITQLQADISFLFAINTSQTWDSYGLLFKHLQRNRALFASTNSEADDEPWELRRSLRLVSALTPQEHGPYVGYWDALQQNAYTTFSEIYDEDSGEDSDEDPQAFAPAPDDTDAPHAALCIKWVDALRAFNPLAEPGQLTDPLNKAAFDDFLGPAMALLGCVSRDGR